ncbi:MAG: ribonuclease D [Acidimicrobiia bacterium]
MTAADGPAADPEPRWIADDASFAAVLDEIAAAPVYGLDTEFHRERTYFAHLALLQLVWPGGLVLVDPLAVDIGPFARVLDGDGACVMHAAVQDLEILRRACGTTPRHLFDTQIAAGFLGYSSPGLGMLVQRELGVALPKTDRLANWMARPLPPGADEYAAADVAHLLTLQDRLVAALEERGRLGWALDECELARLRAVEEPDPERAWWRIKEARQLRGRAAGVAQALAAWRERRAAELDRPIRFVLSDLAIVAMAQRPPTTEAALGQVRGLEERMRRGKGAAELLAVIAAGRELPAEQLHLPASEGPLDKARRATASLVAAWVAQRARDLDLDPSILATRADVESLLAGRGSRLAEGWRADVAGEPIRALASGEAALAVDPGGQLVLEERSHRTL